MMLMTNLYHGINQLKHYSFKPDYKDSVIVLKTAKGKKQIRRIIKMSTYIRNHESEESVWFKRFGLTMQEEEKYIRVA